MPDPMGKEPTLAALPPAQTEGIVDAVLSMLLADATLSGARVAIWASRLGPEFTAEATPIPNAKDMPLVRVRLPQNSMAQWLESFQKGRLVIDLECWATGTHETDLLRLVEAVVNVLKPTGSVAVADVKGRLFAFHVVNAFFSAGASAPRVPGQDQRCQVAVARYEAQFTRKG